MGKVVPVDPFRCRMWPLHDRRKESLTKVTCKAEIAGKVLRRGLGPSLHQPQREPGSDQPLSPLRRPSETSTISAPAAASIRSRRRSETPSPDALPNHRVTLLQPARHQHPSAAGITPRSLFEAHSVHGLTAPLDGSSSPPPWLAFGSPAYSRPTSGSGRIFSACF